MKEEERNQKYMELQLISRQIQQIQEQMQQMQKQMLELNSVNVVLSEVEGSKKDSKTLFSLGAGVFGFGKLEDNSKIIMNVGAKTAVEKSIPDARKIIEEQISEIEKMSKSMESEFIQLHGTMQQMQQELIMATQGKGK